jgi:pilus assembly protein CpaE
MTVLLLTPDADFEERVRTALGPAIDVERVDPDVLEQGARYAVPLIIERHPDATIVCIGPEVPADNTLDLAYEFDLQRPDISVVLCAPASADILSEALHAGVRDVFDPLAPYERILDAYKRATEAAARSRSRVASDDRTTNDARVITVASPKGGSGKTTVASNLAIGLSRIAPNQVAIVDLDLQFGDIATALQLMPDSNIADAAKAVGHLDTMGLKVMLTHHANDLYALCAPNSPVDGERVSPTETARIISLLQQSFKYVIVDTTAGLGEHTLAALEAATDLVLICSMDVPGVRSFRTTLITLDEIGLIAPQRHIVLTRADARVGLAVDDIERTIGRPIDVAIPSSRSVPLSINQGTPILQVDERRSQVTQALWQLTGRFGELPTTVGDQRRRRRRR